MDRGDSRQAANGIVPTRLPLAGLASLRESYGIKNNREGRHLWDGAGFDLAEILLASDFEIGGNQNCSVAYQRFSSVFHVSKYDVTLVKGVPSSDFHSMATFSLNAGQEFQSFGRFAVS